MHRRAPVRHDKANARRRQASDARAEEGDGGRGVVGLALNILHAVNAFGEGRLAGDG